MKALDVNSETPSVKTNLEKIDLASTASTGLRQLIGSPTAVIAAVIVLFLLFGLTQNEQFASSQTWVQMMRDAIFVAMMAATATMVLVSGGLDLSVGSTLVAGAMTASWLATSGLPPIVAYGGAVLIGVGVGLINGSVINFFGIPPIIVTLGTLFAVRSAVTAISQGSPIGPLPADFKVLGQGKLLGIPVPILVGLAVIVLAHIVLSKTNYGWSLRALGGNREAARRSGINVRRISISVYVVSGSVAAFAGALMASRIGSGSPSFGQGYELLVIAAAIIGGTSIAGSIGTVPGAAVGALLLYVLSNGLVLLKIDPNWQDLVIGVVLVSAAGLDIFKRRQMFRTSAKRSAAATASA